MLMIPPRYFTFYSTINNIIKPFLLIIALQMHINAMVCLKDYDGLVLVNDDAKGKMIFATLPCVKVAG